MDRIQTRSHFIRRAAFPAFLALLLTAAAGISQGVIQLPIKLQPKSKPALVVPAVIRRTLPPITHPELLQRTSLAHIFVKTTPNRIFRPGEQVSLTVNAYDAKTGAQLAGLPVTIGNLRGVTSKPMLLTMTANNSQHCGHIDNQQFCLNVLTPPIGVVTAPPDRYPGGGGNFTLWVLVPKLRVGVVGGSVLRPSASFTVSAVDARTGQAVPNAEVLMNGKPLGPTNRPITYSLGPVSQIHPRTSKGMTTLPAAFGPILIVRAPGYSDELVHYVLSNAQSPVVR